VKENRMGDMFLTVVESKPNETEGFERRSVVVFREDMADFVRAFQGALSFMEKPETAKKTLNYLPAEKIAAKKAKTPTGFAGSVPDAPAPGAPEPKKRRIVVRRKPAMPEGEK
jgi:hypothetical protein